MPTTRTIPGSLLQFDTPEWEPLRQLIGEELCGWFMWMHAVQLDDGRELHAYKHIATRRYLHLALDASAFHYVEGRYRPVTRVAAIREGFEGWEDLEPQPLDVEADRAALAKALARARSREGDAA